jgi:serine/threonine protein kinase
VSEPVPHQLGEYQLIEPLGVGGMASVFRGERQAEAGFVKRVAVKRMLPQYRRHPALLERFAAEARTNARLEHPNLVQVVDFGIEPEPYLVMEFVEGVTLSSLLQRLLDMGQRPELSAALFIAAEAAQGLDYAHRKKGDNGAPLGIVHRDVSPQNVLLSNEGAVKVSDFGLVKAADNVLQTGSGVPIGKIAYMAPEQAEHGQVDARADVFSLGVVLWEMLTLRPLMPPRDPAAASQMLKHCHFPLPSSVNPEVSPRLDEIVMQALVRDPTQRTPSAQALGLALREQLHERAPGYGREQLARLVGWAFKERGWQIDVPHEPARQPSIEDRISNHLPEPAAPRMQQAIHQELPTNPDPQPEASAAARHQATGSHQAPSEAELEAYRASHPQAHFPAYGQEPGGVSGVHHHSGAHVQPGHPASPPMAPGPHGAPAAHPSPPAVTPAPRRRISLLAWVLGGLLVGTLGLTAMLFAALWWFGYLGMPDTRRAPATQSLVVARP